jgi:NAD(P)-dependent dehydrogenase (short-subunit alcohol dehydrogenase family)
MDMANRKVLITGATAGIGRQTALALARLGAHVVIVGRDAKKATGVVEGLRREAGTSQVDHLLADLSSLRSVRQLAADYCARFGALHVLINNAGGINPTRQVTVDGYELTFALNHLTYFLLAELLRPALLSGAAGAAEGAPSRIIQLASDAHRAMFGDTRLRFDDLMSERTYQGMAVYGRSKLANILHTRELARRLVGQPITANCVHPGFVASNFLAKPGLWGVIRPLANLFAISEVEGARTSVYLASSDEVTKISGEYFVKCRPRLPSRRAQDAEAAKKLWDVSVALTDAVR